jgi:large subunit ribosomal protein L3
MKSIGILATKLGMTTIFNGEGKMVSVTLLKAGPCPITQIKTSDNDGYSAVQLGFGDYKEKNMSKSIQGHLQKANTKNLRWLKEFRVDSVDGFNIGQEIKTDILKQGDYLDITGVIKGKGFQGVVKRHNFGGGPKTHGQSDRLRHPGAIGSQCPQRVKKNTRMAGHMGNVWRTIQKLQLVKIVPEENLLLVKGSVPGPNNNLLILNKTTKKVKEIKVAQLEKKQAGKGKAPREATEKGKKTK